MQSPERVKRKIADMNANTEQLKPQIAQTDALRAQAQAKDGVFRNLILVSFCLIESRLCSVRLFVSELRC